ncbi:MAG TPA: LptA/OstA family protein [Vineibacter sp.]|nr:LptA/OstA family protein [Vineibacter sp.]
MIRLARWLTILALVSAAPAAAQQTPAKPRDGTPKASQKGEDDKSDKSQIEISADQGIEWDKNSHRYVARGNARVTRGEQTLSADVITAYHRGEGTKKGDIFRVDAEGTVRIANADMVVTGDRGVYDVDNKVARLTGRNLSLANDDSRLMARDSLEYWDEKRLAVARGNVVILKGPEELRAEQVVAYYEPKDGSQPDPNKSGGKQRVARVEGYGKVYIASCNGYAHADKALYDPNTGTAVLTGNVRLTRGREQMNGETAEMNTKTGFARIVGPGGGRVSALLEANRDASTPEPNPTGRPGVAPCEDKQDDRASDKSKTSTKPR